MSSDCKQCKFESTCKFKIKFEQVKRELFPAIALCQFFIHKDCENKNQKEP